MEGFVAVVVEAVVIEAETPLAPPGAPTDEFVAEDREIGRGGPLLPLPLLPSR